MSIEVIKHDKPCEAIKKNIDLADYVRSRGITLSKHGRNDLKGLCPFHDDKKPSLIISPAKRLFNCPVCNTGGSVIDFAMKLRNCSLTEAIKKLSEKLRTSQKTATKKNNLRDLAPSREISIERQNELLEKTVSFYEKTFANVAEGKQYLEKRGITDAGLFSKHRVGYADGSLLKALPSEGKILEDLKQLGILLDTPGGNFKERFKDCVVFPVLDVEGNITTLYGRSIEGKKHVFLPGRPTGLFNAAVIKTYPEIILVESAINVLSMEMAGLNNVVSIQGTNGLSRADLGQFRENDVEKIILLLDGDEAGRKASHRLMGELAGQFKVSFRPVPDSMDPNDYLLKHGPEKLQSLLSDAPPEPAEEEKNISANQCPSVVEKNSSVNSVPSVVNRKDGFIVNCGLRKYEILGLEKKQRSLKATLRAEKAGRLHVDTIDFYSSRQRRQLCRDLCGVFEEVPETIDGDIAKLLRACESREANTGAGQNGGGAAVKGEPVLSLAERQEAEKFGGDLDLMNRILDDYEKCGLIGEDSNKLLCYLAMTSRKMAGPLSVLILSSSGAGKTALQDTALGFCPPEDLVKLTSLSAKALFYKEQASLKHKVLAIEEGAGAEDAGYAIRNLISSNGLTSEVAIRDPQTGKLTTMANTVDGPTAVFCTTTDPEVDPETKSRFLVTGIDESREQTRRILEFQRRRSGLGGLEDDLEKEKTLRVHRNFQRLLKPLAVVNPHAGKLSYEDDRLQGRRAQPQYLNIISSVAFLRQMQKEVKEHAAKKKKVEYVEVDETDIEIGGKLAVEILGRTLDELSIPARNLLELIGKYVGEKVCALRKCDSERLIRKTDITFTRRELREFTGWTQTRLRNHLKELIDLEYILIDSGANGRVLQTYKFVYDGQGRDGEKFIPGVKRS